MSDVSLDLILTIDVGTTNLKCILFDENGNEVLRVTRPNTTKYPQSFCAEQDPQQWVNNLVALLRSISQSHPEKLHSIKAISLTGQMHGPVLFDKKSGDVLYPCVVWSDTRAHEEVEILWRTFTSEFFLKEMGNPLQQSFTLPKLLWLKRHKPEVFEKSPKLLFPKDYIAYLLGGTITTDYSDASGSLFFNLRKKEWEGEVLRELEFPREMLPEVVDSDSIVGRVSKKAAIAFSLPSGVPIVKGGGDLATTALATVAGAKENLSLCVGTAGQLLLCAEGIEEEVLGRLYVFLHCIKDKYFYLGTVPTGGASLSWFSSLFIDKDQELWERVGKLVDIPLQRTILFYPFLLGTGTPHFDYRAKAAFLGLQMHHKVEDVVIAVLEGVAFALRESLEKVPVIAERVQKVVLSGGLARFPLFSRIVCGVFNRPVTLLRYADTASMGAFLLAAKAVGILNHYEGNLLKLEENTLFPERLYVQYYDRMYALYQSFLDVVLSFAAKSHRFHTDEGGDQ